MPPRAGGHKQFRCKRRRDDETSSAPNAAQQRQSFIAAAASVVHSPLFLWIISHWAWGAISAPAAQQCAKAAALSGTIAEDVEQLSRIGAHGHSPEHCQRDMVAKFCTDLQSPEPFEWMVPVRAKDHETLQMQVKKVPVHLLLPHEWLASLVDEFSQQDILGISGIADFWAGLSMSDPKLIGNAVMDVPNFQQIVLPLLLHGDGAQFAERDSLLVISMKSVLSKSSTAASQLLLAAMPKQSRNKSQNPDEDTWHEIWKVLAWSFTALFYGKHPKTDPDNKPWPPGSRRQRLAGKPLLPNGIRGWIYCLAGDLDYLCNEYELNHFASSKPCFLCDCDWQKISPYDFRPTALWMKTKRARQNPPTKHAVFSIPGVVLESVGLDCLHTLELGMVAHLIGNLFFELCYFELPGTRAMALAALFKRILEIYRELGITKSRISTLKYEHFCDPAKPHKIYPCLHASAIKGRETRYLVPVALQLCREHAEGQHAGHRLRCFEHLNAVYELLDQRVYNFTSDQKAEFRIHMMKCLQHYLVLHKEAADAGKMLWNITIKAHFAAHLCDQADHSNPRVWWCYGSESMVGRISRLASSCTAGTASYLVSLKLMDKYRAAIHIMWKYFGGAEMQDDL